MQIGPYKLDNNLVLAPMAGVTDRPFRMLCKQLGAGMAVSEMVTANTVLYSSAKTLTRIDHTGESSPRVVQIAGSDPAMMAEAAQLNVERGAEIIDINMGCPAKKVCSKMAGSALLADEALVADILRAVVQSVKVPVSLKIRTGVARSQRNGVRIANIAEDSGVVSLAVHGRTREDKYLGDAEFETIKSIVQNLTIPVIANGDITTPERAKWVLEHTGAAGIMIGRGAHGRPWIFREIAHYLASGDTMPGIDADERRAIVLAHLRAIYDFYGEARGVRMARKHIAWYCKDKPGAAEFRNEALKLDDIDEQYQCVQQFFSGAEHDQNQRKKRQAA